MDIAKQDAEKPGPPRRRQTKTRAGPRPMEREGPRRKEVV